MATKQVSKAEPGKAIQAHPKATAEAVKALLKARFDALGKDRRVDPKTWA